MIPNLFHSEDFTKIAEALSKALPNIEAATKDKENPHFRSKYADLSSIMDVCKAPLAEVGIIVMQPPSSNGDKVSVSTVLMHSSGQWMACNLEMQPVKGDPQGYGSALTYARRYSLMTACGIAPEDDDGNSAAKAKPAPSKPATQPAKASPPPAKIEGKEGPWQLKVSIEPEGSFVDWASIVMDATKLGLEQAANEADVMAIFRNNKNIYDRMKAEPDSSSYEVLMEEFKTARNKFKGQA